MRFPQAFLDELRARLSIVDVVGRRVTWDKGKSIPARGDMWACCPFHGEKTPSFHVREKEDHFYCFGCHESGSTIDFVMKMDRLSFPEAVEALAGEAGLKLPERDPAEARKAAKRAELTDVMEAAGRAFREALAGPEGAEARAYLAGRGLDAAIIERFEIGFAPPGQDRLARRLVSELSVSADMLAACDLAKPSDRGPGLYDRFRERIMFPIRDARGRLIAFGGRALRDDAKAKYLNSSETELFQKRRTVYNLGPARAATAKGRPLLIVEGYMDVIGLAQAGFEAAVAPLGTALTEDQLTLIWGAAAEPVAAFDGDAAGLRAARKAADLACSHAAPGRSLSFAMLPPGLDPDDLARRDGAAAIEALVASAAPLVEMLWRGATEGKRFETPERRAALEADLDAIAGRVAHEGVRRHYKSAFRERRFQLFRRAGAPTPPRGGGRPTRRGGRWDAPAWAYEGPSEAVRRTALAREADEAATLRRAASLLRFGLARPDLVEAHEEDLVSASFGSAELDTFRDALISALGDIDAATDDWDDAALAAYRAAVTLRAGDATIDTVLNIAGGADRNVGTAAEPAVFAEALGRALRDAAWRAEVQGLEAACEGPQPIESEADADGDADAAELRRLRALSGEPTGAADAADADGRDVYAQRLNALIDGQPWIRARKRSTS